MASHHASLKNWLSVILVIIFTASSGCSPSTNSSPSSPDQPTKFTTSFPQLPSELDAEASFQVKVPEDTPADGKVDLNILDEVTGLAINPSSYRMESIGNRIYRIKLPLRLGSVIKYRYTLENTLPLVEYTSHNEPVRYRMCLVTSPLALQDVITSWKASPSPDKAGEIQGVVREQKSLAPIPGLLVSAGGQLAITTSDGSFNFYGLPEGTHNMLVYAMDGSIQPFQQGANVLAGMTTPASIEVLSHPRVNVTFNVTVPKENVLGLPVRIAGNLLSLGNTFSDLSSGLSVLGSRMPLMAQQSDGHYALTLNLPAGTELEYKYTLGDGFWNGELTQDGRYNIRKITVPDHDQVVEDWVATWRSPGFSPVTINLTTPQNTPSGDMVAIQFKPFGWTEPVPMWSLGNNRWIYILYNPLNLSGSLAYRFCRNEQCGSTDNETFASAKLSGGVFTSSPEPQVFNHEIKAWDNWETIDLPTQVVAADIKPRGSDFMAGVEFSPLYHTTWLPYLGPVYQNLRSISANWVVVRPSWSYPQDGTPQLFQNPSYDMLWNDMLSTIGYARNQGLNVALYPAAHFPQDIQTWWQNAPRNSTWWEAWFDRYRAFILHFADLGTQTGASALILGGDWLSPALPGGRLADGTPSIVPEDAQTRWMNLIQDIKSHYSGKLLWAISFPANFSGITGFFQAVDAIYLELNTPLTEDPSYTENSLLSSFTTQVQEQIQPWVEELGKPAVVALEYPSAKGSARACIQSTDDECLRVQPIGGLSNSSANIQPDLEEQVNIYNAIFGALNGQSWVIGIISKDYYPPVALQDGSASIHGKPATDVLWYWFSKILSPQS